MPFAKLSSSAAAGLLLAYGLLLAVAGTTAEAQSQGAASQPVVVELFTSQGCSSCPPADALLTELAKQPGVIALSMHVDYWDYIGWKDPFASPLVTKRQHGYSKAFGKRYVYTPQMVIDGRLESVGSRRDEVEGLIDRAGAEPKPLTLRFEEGDGGAVVIPAGDAPDEGATVWLAVYDESHDTDIGSGENRGRRLHYSHVVRELEEIGRWHGEEMVVPLDLAAAAARGRNGCAVIVQRGRTGPVLGALAMDLPAAE